VYNKFIDEIGMSSTVVAIPSVNIADNDFLEEVNQGSDASKRSAIDCVIVSRSKQIVTLAKDVTQVVDQAVKAITSCVLKFVSDPCTADEHRGTKMFNPAYLVLEKTAPDALSIQYIRDIAKDVNKALEKITAVWQAVDMARSEIWKVVKAVFTESENEKMAEDLANVEVKPWDELKVKVWEAVKNWMNTSVAVEANIQAWKAFQNKNGNKLLTQQAWDTALAEERKAFQAVQAENWDEMTTQAWGAARTNLYQVSKDWNTLSAEILTLELEANKAMDAAITATVEAAQTWRQASDKILAVSNAKRNPGTQKGQRILSIFKS
jgi:hypothetical protein